jgi:DNA helicase-2/ATP-dependent DNA helicase PcrA
MFPISPWEVGLDDAQLAVARHGDSPLLVVAGAGTGKTRALVSRVACLMQRGVAAERILLLTFTRRAADEMLARAAHLAGAQGDRRPWGGTFHAVAHRYVAAYAEVLGFSAGFSVMSPSEACDLMELMRGQYDLGGPQQRFPRSATLVEVYSRCINTFRPLHEVLKVSYPWCEPHRSAMAELFAAFTSRKNQAALVDFDDLLLYWRALLSQEDLGPRLAAQFDYVLVDEYQDVNGLQVDIVRLLAPEGKGLTVVGDEAQAIYGFRGAGPRHLRELLVDHPEASIIRLERNFRSRQSILDVANSVRPADGGPAVTLWSGRGQGPKPVLSRCHDAGSEARAIVDRALEAHERGTALHDQAVLVRAAHHSDLVELELSARRVPYRKYGGLRLLETAHVKDFVAAARLLDNPHDEVAWFRLLRLHDHIGPATARALVERARAPDDALEQWPEMVAAAPARARAALSGTLDKLQGARAGPGPRQRAEVVVEALRPLLVGRYADADVRLADLERLVGAASEVSDLAAWLAELTLDPPQSTSDYAGPPHLDEDYLVVSTIHSAKGLEWSVVHLPHVIDGCIPIDMALGTPDGLEEERRLFYVAVTRARDELYLYSPLRMPYHRRARDDLHGFSQLSRFVDAAVAANLEVVDQPRPGFDVPVVGAATRVSVDLSSLWA